jgi:hypothetical protein
MAKIERANEADVTEIVSVRNDAFRVEADFRAGDRTSPDEVISGMTDVIESSHR